MIEKLRKLPLHKRKIMMWVITGTIGLFLLTFRTVKTVREVREGETSFFPTIEKEKISEDIREKGKKIEDSYKSAIEKTTQTAKISEEEWIEKLKKENIITEEDIEKLLYEKEIKKSDLEEGELIKLIEKEILNKEKNDSEEK